MAFAYDKDELQDLNALIRPDSGWTLQFAMGINNRGEIVGYGLYNNKFRAFLLTPQHGN